MSKSTWSSKQFGLRLECLLLAEGVHDLKTQQDHMARELKQEQVGSCVFQQCHCEIKMDGAIIQHVNFSVHAQTWRMTRDDATLSSILRRLVSSNRVSRQVCSRPKMRPSRIGAHDPIDLNEIESLVALVALACDAGRVCHSESTSFLFPLSRISIMPIRPLHVSQRFACFALCRISGLQRCISKVQMRQEMERQCLDCVNSVEQSNARLREVAQLNGSMLMQVRFVFVPRRSHPFWLWSVGLISTRTDCKPARAFTSEMTYDQRLRHV